MDTEFDRKHLWHPYTSATKPDKAYPVLSANACKITVEPNVELIDAMSSWWAAIHGYSHPAIVEAICAQAKIMSHVMFGGLTHESAIELGKKLLSLLSDAADSQGEKCENGFEHVFFADSGSVAVEVAMKTAVQYQKGAGFPKKSKFLTVKNGYHGDTVGAMSVCDPISGMHSLFSDLLPKQFFAPPPPLGFEREITQADFAEITKIALEKQDEIAAVIIEPIVQGAGGMRIYSPQYLKKLRALCDKFGFVLIFDEIATGFGRTGKMFAFQHAGVIPDIICLGKALTGGTLTLSATLTSEKIAKTACKDGLPLMHGPTFMANPLACAAAKANLDLLTSWKWQEKVLLIESFLKKNLCELADNRTVADVRVLGAIGVVEMKEKINVAEFQKDCISQGVWVRPFGKLAYVMPPYVISEEELAKVAGAVKFAVNRETKK